MMDDVISIISKKLKLEDDGAITAQGIIDLGNKKVPCTFELDLNDQERKAISEWLKDNA